VIYQPRKRLTITSTQSSQIVVPGEVICESTGYLPGHGTYIDKGNLVASIAGVVERINKLICVKSLMSRYTGDVGDIVVGRVLAVGQERWRIDINAKQDGILVLSSINLPGGVLRRRTFEDQLKMRDFFVENDVISAEVQSIYQDGSLSLHTRHNYGKLKSGVLIKVQPTLVKRCKSHFVSLPKIGVNIILGINGYIWISPTPSESAKEGEEEITTNEIRENICRIRNSIIALSKTFRAISPESISVLYERSLEYTPKQMLHPSVILFLTDFDLIQNEENN